MGERPCRDSLRAILVVLLLTPGASSEETKADASSCLALTEPVHLKHGQLPKTALASFQGSGNTWVRQILASSTGYKTGDIYNSYGNDVYPEFSSKHDDTVLAIKTHTFSHDTTSSFKRALVIARHPLDALYSEFNRMYGGNKTGYADKYNLVNEDGSTSWKWDMWMTHIGSWIDFYTFWLREYRGDAHIIYYKNLKANTADELSRAIRFLGLTPDLYRLNCTLYHPKPSYFQRPHTEPPVQKYDLFRLSMSKARKAVEAFKTLVKDRFGSDSDLYKRLDLEISEPRLQ